MSALGGLLLAAAALLAGAGAAKLARPAGTARALGVAPALVRVGAGAEVVAGAGAAVAGGRVAPAALGLSYLAFAVFVAVALRRGWALSSCGCFGEPDSPPTGLHALLDVGFAGVGAAAAVTATPAPLAQVVHRPAAGAAMVVLAVVTAWLAAVALSLLPRLGAEVARR